VFSKPEFIGEGTIRRPRECVRLLPFAELPRGGVGAPSSASPVVKGGGLGFRCAPSDAAAASNAELSVVGAPVRNTRSPPPTPPAELPSCSSGVPNIAGLPSRVARAELASSRLRNESGMNASGGVAFIPPRNCAPDRAGAGTGASWYAAVGSAAGAGAARGNGSSNVAAAFEPDPDAAAVAFCCALRGVLGGTGAAEAGAARTWWICASKPERREPAALRAIVGGGWV
jgi:hypothetical protein